MKLYIDPGTGSMLFSLALGLISFIWYGTRKLYMKVKYLTPGRTKSNTNKKDIVIYGEDNRYFTSFKSILDEFENRQIPVTYLAGSEDDPLLTKNYQYVETELIGLGNKAYAKLNFLNAHICVATTPGLDVYQWKRSKDVDWYVHMLHALRGVTTYRMFGTEFYDAILTSAEVDNIPIREMENKRKSKKKELVVVGSTMMDYLKKRFKEQGGKEPHDGVNILLAPSWGPNSIFNRFGEKLLDALLSTGYNIIIRPHPQSFIVEQELMNMLQKKYPESGHIHWNRDVDNFDVLSKTDLMISDYSSVIFDYAFIFDGPIIYADVKMDWSVYDQYWCDTPNYHLEILSRIGIELNEEDFSNIKTLVDRMLTDVAYAEARHEVRDECWKYQGDAAKRIVDYVIRKNEELKMAEQLKQVQKGTKVVVA